MPSAHTRLSVNENSRMVKLSNEWDEIFEIRIEYRRYHSNMKNKSNTFRNERVLANTFQLKSHLAKEN